MRSWVACGLAFVMLAGQALAGPMADFETSLRDAYASYRTALFMTNTGKAADSAKAVSTFVEKWQALGEAWRETPPPQYADDPNWLATFVEVKRIAGDAAAEVEAGKLAEAHETLEAIRAQIGDLHVRNGLMLFSDRMNAYHAEMEKVLAMAPGESTSVIEAAAVLHYLAAELLSHPPRDAAGSPEFETLAKGVEKSVADFLEAARSDDMAKLKAAMGSLKPAYAKLFLKFG